MPLDIDKYTKSEIKLFEEGTETYFNCLYLILGCNIILNLFFVLLKVVQFNFLFSLGLISNLIYFIVLLLTQKYNNKYILWAIFVVNILNFKPVLLLFSYTLPIYAIGIILYKNMNKEYKPFINIIIDKKVNHFVYGLFSFVAVLCYFVLFCYFAYYEWLIISKNFIQFFNPFSYVWAIISSLKEPLTYMLIYWSIIVFCLQKTFEKNIKKFKE